MAKKRRARPVTEGLYPTPPRRPPSAQRAPRHNVPPPSSRGISTTWLALGAAGVVLVVVVAGYAFLSGGAGSASPSPQAPASFASGVLHPPSATPLASPPAEPAGDGTTATISTPHGDITIELFTESAPVASENFINLAEAGYYRGTPFHRIIPDFMIQGGDPTGTGSGGPGYTIEDEPIVGSYTRGMVAMARTSQPHSQGSQFFILVGDAPWLKGGGYTIFGKVTQGLDVADEIVSGPRTGPQQDLAVDPVRITDVSVQRP